MKKFVFKHTASTYISELPEYKLPSLKYVAKEVFDKVMAFIKELEQLFYYVQLLYGFYYHSHSRWNMESI